MKIQELIDTLTAIALLMPDTEVECRNGAGEFDSVGSTMIAVVPNSFGGKPRKALLIDT